eukprot:ctg_1432.g330
MWRTAATGTVGTAALPTTAPAPKSPARHGTRQCPRRAPDRAPGRCSRTGRRGRCPWRPRRRRGPPDSRRPPWSPPKTADSRHDWGATPGWAAPTPPSCPRALGLWCAAAWPPRASLGRSLSARPAAVAPLRRRVRGRVRGHHRGRRRERWRAAASTPCRNSEVPLRRSTAVRTRGCTLRQLRRASGVFRRFADTPGTSSVHIGVATPSKRGSDALWPPEGGVTYKNVSDEHMLVQEPGVFAELHVAKRQLER